ncbi:unnamed protein product, partial [Brenthis ino]
MRYFCVLFAAILVSNVCGTRRVLPIKRNTQNNTLGLHRSNAQRSTTTRPNNACVFDKPPTPNFNAPGRRISTAKCLEYIRQRSDRAETKKKMEESGQGYKNYYVYGGRNALSEEFPHMGAVGWKPLKGNWIFKCGCSLISSKFTLTAAHCTKSSRDTRLQSSVPEIVRLGVKNIFNSVYVDGLSPQDSKILRIIVHPAYSSPTKYFDIALMEISEVLTFTKHLQPACLWTNFDISKLGTSATLTGWGAIDAETKTSPNLQAAVVDIIDSKQCDALLKHTRNRLWGGLEHHQLCGGKKSGGVDSCQGDSGGPLQVKIALPEIGEGTMHFIIGVTSFGTGCGLPNQPGVYTRVSSFIDWIESIVWKDN